MTGAPDIYTMESAAPTCMFRTLVSEHPQTEYAHSEGSSDLVVNGVKLGEQDTIN